MRPVEESTRIDIAAVLAKFQAGDETELTFPPDLNNHERAIVHAECKKYGFTSKSSGKGESRAVTVFKRRQPKNGNPAYELPMSESTLQRLDSYFSTFPATPTELQQAAGGPDHDAPLSQAYGSAAAAPSPKASGRKGKQGTPAARFDEPEILKRQQRWEESISQPDMQPVIAAREALPIAAFREEIVAAVRQHQVVLIAGETGCGKTTQVPQYLLEDSWYRGQGLRVVCTQPRRLSAMSVAERVASERGEDIGTNVGYTIRLDSRGGPDCSLMFCTNGILLRMLTSPGDDGISNVTHLVIDEIHERDRFADFLLIMVRDILPSRPDLRVILMSATLHVDLFSAYFQGCPVVRVPGFTHPVQDFYLEDILKLTGYQAATVAEYETRHGVSVASVSGVAGGQSAASDGAISNAERDRVEAAIEAAFRTGSDEAFDVLLEVTGAAGADDASAGCPAINVQHSQTGITALLAAAFHGRVDVATVLLANGADPSVKAQGQHSARSLAKVNGHADVVELLEEFEQRAAMADEIASSALALTHYQSNTDADEVDLQLIEELLKYICGEGKFRAAAAAAQTEGSLGAILIFLPGWDEIIRLKDRLEGSPIFKTAKYQLLPLHSQVVPAEQKLVFKRPPAGVRKIVMATNIAETAITIDDVVCVIDSGRQKEKSYDAYTGVSTLQSAWISQASEKQRRGRAGRCQPGVAFHMYSRQRSEALAEFQLPEIKRSPLDEMALQVKLLEKPRLKVSIADFLAKAVEPPVEQAVKAAVALLADIGALDTEEHLTNLGRHLAALPLPPALGKMLLYAVLYQCLDPVLTVACFQAFRDPWVLPAQVGARKEAVMRRGQFGDEAGGGSDHLAMVLAYNGWKAARARNTDRGYCAHNFLSPATMNMVDGMRDQLLGELVNRGLIRSLDESNTQGEISDLVRSVLACGYYPRIGRLVPVPAFDTKARTSMLTREGDRVRVHPASINSKLRIEKPEVDKDDDSEPPPEVAALMFYDEVTRGDSFLYVKTCSAFNAHPIVLVAAQVAPAPDPQASIDPGDAAVQAGVQGMQLGDLDKAAPHVPDGTAAAVPPTGLLVVDQWLRFRVPFSAVGQLSCLRLRIAEAFAHKVTHPWEELPPSLQGALDVSSALFTTENGSEGGMSAMLGTSYAPGAAQGGYRGGRGHPGNRNHHMFRFNAAAPGRGGRYSGGRSDGSGSWRNDRGASMPYPGGPYAPRGGHFGGRGSGGGGSDRGGGYPRPSFETGGYQRGRGRGRGGRASEYDYDDRHGVKRSHSGTARESGGEAPWGGRGGGGRGRGRRGGRY